jgi:hypothetical protein
LKLEIEKLRRTLYGARSERRERLVDQLEMQLAAARLRCARARMTCSDSRVDVTLHWPGPALEHAAMMASERGSVCRCSR